VTATTTQTINLHTAARHFQGRLSIWTNLYKKCLQKKKTVQKITEAGWVKDLAFTKNNTAKDIQRILLANFTTLMGPNLSK